VEVLISFSRGFYPPQNNFQEFFKPPQIGSPQVICEGFLQPLVPSLYCGSFLMEGYNLSNSLLLFCGGLKPLLFPSTYLIPKFLFFIFFVGVNTLLNSRIIL